MGYGQYVGKPTKINADSNSSPKHQETGPDKMSKEDWAAKDRRIARNHACPLPPLP